jgi:hypothetical protein
MKSFNIGWARLLAIVIFSAAALVAAHAQAPGTITPLPPDPTARPPYGIDIKRPLLAAACKGCPWGAIG